MELHVAPVRPETEHRVFDALSDGLLSVSQESAVFRAGFAYATLGGVEVFLSHAETHETWGGLRKEIIVGVHHAITEPSAIELLRTVPCSDIRVFVPGRRMLRGVFDAKPVFHPKVIAVTSREGANVGYLQVGSTNWTAAAIGRSPRNYEFSLAVVRGAQRRIDDRGAFYQWWAPLWEASRIASSSLIEKYARLRQSVLDENPVLRGAADIPGSISDARFFFIEVGAGSGPPGRRHQVEFPEGLARFFGPVTRERRDLALRSGVRVWRSRPLSYKRTTFDVEIWRLGMPTLSMDGEPIVERVIGFTRTGEEGEFAIDVVDSDGDTHRRWLDEANRHGHLGATRGARSRRYGFF